MSRFVDGQEHPFGFDARQDVVQVQAIEPLPLQIDLVKVARLAAAWRDHLELIGGGVTASARLMAIGAQALRIEAAPV